MSLPCVSFQAINTYSLKLKGHMTLATTFWWSGLSPWAMSLWLAITNLCTKF